MKNFIVIDGPDGVGKTTLAKSLVESLRVDAHCKAIYTCEPTRTPLGMRIRAHLRANDIDPLTFMDLFIQDRAAHIRDTIEPALKAGYVVVCDRYKYSTICYQHLHGVPLDVLLSVNQFQTPDIVFILSLAPEVIFQRIAQRGRERDMFENDQFVRQACEIFQRMSSLFPDETFVNLNAAHENNELTAIVLKKVLR